MSRAIVAEAVGVTVTRDGRPVLEGPTLRLHAGAITLLVGPNGAGKTTLLRALAGVLPLSAGAVNVGGRDPRRDPQARASLALVPQEIALYPRLTVRENLETFAAFAGRPRHGAHVEAAIAQASLVGAADRLVATLSGGLQRRVNIAGALVASPRLLLLDEPTAGLDVVARRAVLAALREIATRAGLAILMTTHDLDDAEVVADEVAVLRQGRLLAAGHPGALVTRAFPGLWQRVELLLTAPPDDALAACLSAKKLHPLADRTHWRGYAPAGGAETVVAGLDERQVREVRLRRPGLEDAYTTLLDEPAAA